MSDRKSIRPIVDPSTGTSMPINPVISSKDPTRTPANRPVTSLSPTQIPISPLIAGPQAIEDKYASLGGAGGSLGNPTGTEMTAPDQRGAYRHYQNGSIYWTKETGAHEIHGDILAKWASLGWERGFLGYPMTDETSTPDQVGRYNHFQGGSIYWTPQTGAWEVHGDIRGKWESLGWERSYLGYPVSDEHDDGQGRRSDFQNGSISWTGDAGAQDLPQTFAVDSPNIVFGTGLSVGGSGKMVLYSNGHTTFQGALHDSGFPSFDYMAVFTVKGTDQMAYTLAHSGRLHGTDEQGSRDDSWNEAGDNDSVKANWPAIRGGSGGSTVTITSDWSPQKIAEDVVSAVGFVLGVVGLVVAVV